MQFLPRLAGRAVDAALGAVPVVVLMGARQTGKTTLVREHASLAGRAYVTLDDLDIRAQARKAPDDLVARAAELTLDEIQREADVVLAVKRAVDGDRPRRNGRFVLTGSANLLLMRRVSETLAGRASYVTLWPLTRRERLGLGSAGIWSDLLEAAVEDWDALVRSDTAPPEDWRDVARAGGYPTPAHELEEQDARTVWFRGYVQTYLERDLQDLAAIDNLVDFRRLMRAAALRLGTVVNQAEVARDVGLSRPTVHRYLNLLETSYQVVRVEPYTVNRTKRLIKSPKLYWADAGLALHVAGSEPGGAHLENVVLSDLVAWRDAHPATPQVLHWRTVNGEEVDFVVELGDRLLPIEVKATTRPSPSDARHLRTFCEQYGEAVPGGLLLHGGEEVVWLARGILAAPWWRIV